MLALHPNDRLELVGFLLLQIMIGKRLKSQRRYLKSWAGVEAFILLDRNAIGADESRTLWRQHETVMWRHASVTFMVQMEKTCGYMWNNGYTAWNPTYFASSIFCAHGWPQQVPMSMLPTSIPPVLPSVMFFVLCVDPLERGLTRLWADYGCCKVLRLWLAIDYGLNHFGLWFSGVANLLILQIVGTNPRDFCWYYTQTTMVNSPFIWAWVVQIGVPKTSF